MNIEDSKEKKELINFKKRQAYQQNKDKIKAEAKHKYKEDMEEKKKRLAINKKWREANKEKIKQISQIYYKKTKDQRIKHYQENKEIYIKKIKIWNENNKDKISEYYKRYREKNKNILLNYLKNYRINNNDKIKKYREDNYKCKKCELFLTKKQNNYLCSYCNPNKTKYRKTKEIQVKTFLEENNYKFEYNKKCNLNNSCQTYYPDFLIDNNSFFIIIECDEEAHKSYDINCEKTRENNICFALGLPCVFIRYNPDRKGIKMKIKQHILKSYIDYYINLEKSDNECVYLFY